MACGHDNLRPACTGGTVLRSAAEQGRGRADVTRCAGNKVTARAHPALRACVHSCLRAFTLIEMLVSLAVLSLAMAVVGVVFSVTTKTTSQAAAYSEAHNWVRQFTLQIEEDLRYCDPSKSVLVLVGRTQAAALTADDLQAGKFHRVLIGDAGVAGNYDPEYTTGAPNPQYSNPRADLLMFFSQRPTVSVAPVPDVDPSDEWAYAAALGTRFTPVEVVYGHAAFASPVWNAGRRQYEFPTNPAALRHIEQVAGGGTDPLALSRIPANQWHLSRRATIMFDWGNWTVPTAESQWNVAQGAWYNDTSNGWLLPGDAVMFGVTTLLNYLGPHWTLAGLGSPAALERPYGPFYGGFNTILGAYIEPLLYSQAYSPLSSFHHVATVLDDVPVDLQGNMAVQMLPACAWFQVEFLMPEDPRNSVTYASPAPLNINVSSRSDMPRWTSVVPGETYIFVPDTPDNRNLLASDPTPANLNLPSPRLLNDFARLDQTPGNDASQPGTIVSNRIIRTWPYAIRVTVRVWDPRGRLDEPIVRSLVHRFE